MEYTGRLYRARAKRVISGELAGIFDRLGSNAESWWTGLENLSKGRLLGRFFAASRARLREAAACLGVHHLANLGGCRRDDAVPKARSQARLQFHSSGDTRKIPAILSYTIYGGIVLTHL